MEESPIGHHYLETINPFLWILVWRQFPSDDHAPCFAHVLIMLHKGFMLHLAGGISTPLNNMSSSVGILKIPNWMEKQHISQWIHKTTNKSYVKPAMNGYSKWMDIPNHQPVTYLKPLSIQLQLQTLFQHGRHATCSRRDMVDPSRSPEGSLTYSFSLQ